MGKATINIYLYIKKKTSIQSVILGSDLNFFFYYKDDSRTLVEKELT